jgi:hypothetical protein
VPAATGAAATMRDRPGRAAAPWLVATATYASGGWLAREESGACQIAAQGLVVRDTGASRTDGDPIRAWGSFRDRPGPAESVANLAYQSPRDYLSKTTATGAQGASPVSKRTKIRVPARIHEGASVDGRTFR